MRTQIYVEASSVSSITHQNKQAIALPDKMEELNWVSICYKSLLQKLEGPLTHQYCPGLAP